MALIRVPLRGNNYCKDIISVSAVGSMLSFLSQAEGQGLSVRSLGLHTATFQANSITQRAKMLLPHQGSETRRVPAWLSLWT